MRFPFSAFWALQAAWILFGSALHAEVQLPGCFSHHAVLQREKPVAIWGTAAAEEAVSVRFAGQNVSTVADGDGHWKVNLSAMPANDQPQDLIITGSNEVVLHDVLVGEVWLCSGQSNMHWYVRVAANPQEEIAAANDPLLRMFTVPQVTAKLPQRQLAGEWQLTTPETVGAFSATAYYFGRQLRRELKIPIGLLRSSWGGTPAEAWISREALEERPCAAEMLKAWDERAQRAPQPAPQEPPAQMKKKKGKPRHSVPQDSPGALFNAMISPLIPYSLRGALWYQGEANHKRAVQYQELLPSLILDWRERWQQDFPFYIVQLANFGNKQPVTTEPGQPDAWAELQEAQLLTALTLPKTRLAVINDIGAQDDIHPKNKQEVGRRLSLLALANEYGRKELVSSGPLFKEAVTEGQKVRIRFTHTGGSLKTRDGGPLKHFQICGADQKWVWAQAEIDHADELLISSPAVPQPAGVRYAWASWPEGANLVNAAGLPASLFRTDEFPLSTVGKVNPLDKTPTPGPAEPENSVPAE